MMENHHISSHRELCSSCTICSSRLCLRQAEGYPEYPRALCGPCVPVNMPDVVDLSTEDAARGQVAQQLVLCCCRNALAAYQEALAYAPNNSIAMQRMDYCKTRVERLGL